MDCAILVAGHRAIAEAAEAMAATLATPPVDVNALARHRMTLSIKIREQMQNEDRMILPILQADGLASLPPLIRDIIDRRTQLARRYSEHVGRWNLSTVAADIDGFHAEVTTYFDEAIALIAAQQRTLFPYVEALANRTRSTAARPLPPPPPPIASRPAR